MIKLGDVVMILDLHRQGLSISAEHEGEQPHDPYTEGSLDDLEVSKVDLSLVSWRRLEANLECRQWRWPQLAKQIRDGGVAAGVTSLAQLPPQSLAGQAWVGRDPLPQVPHERINPSRTGLARSVHWRLQAASNRSANRP